MLRLARVTILALVIIGCGADSTNPGTPPPPPAPQPPPPPPPPAPTDVVLQAALPASGGTLRVSKSGDPLDGMSITVPAAAYPGQTNWTVTELKDVHPSLPAKVRQVGPTIGIQNGQGFSAIPFTISIPARVRSDSGVAAFFRDPESNTLEAIPIVARTDTSLVVISRHVSAAHLLLPSGPAAAAAGSAGAPASGTVQIILVSGAAVDLRVRVSTSFEPGVDDWEFTNYGSYLVSGGYCAGSTLSALYHNYVRKAVKGPLFRLYDDVPGLDDDNPRGIRMASMVQSTTQWGKGGVFRQWVQAAMSAAGVPLGAPTWVQTQMESLALAMLVTGRAQQLAIYRPGGTDGHALVAYGFEWGKIYVADPNDPGVQHSIDFTAQGFVPFNFADKAGSPQALYTEVFTIAVSAVVPVNGLGPLWNQLEAGTVGNDSFPALMYQYRDPVDTVWRTAAGTIPTASSRITFRTRCQLCKTTRGHTANPLDRILTVVYNTQGALVGNDDPDDVAGFDMAVLQGTNRYGLSANSFSPLPAADNDGDWYYQDFSWVQVKSVAFDLSASPAQPAPGATVTFSVDNGGLGTSAAHYRWTVGTAAPVTTPFSQPTLTQTIAVPAGLTVIAELIDADGSRLGRATLGFAAPGPWRVINRGQAVCGITKADLGYCWGTGGRGELGNGANPSIAPLPLPVSGGHHWTTITSVSGATCGMTTAGEAFCWGENSFGVLGIGNAGTSFRTNVPVKLAMLPAIRSISLGNNHGCAVTTAGVGYCWGDNRLGQLGNAAANVNWEVKPVPVDGGHLWLDIAAGISVTCGITVNHDAYCWGAGTYGELGNGSTVSKQVTPVPVSGGFKFVSITLGQYTASCGITTAAEGVCWGLKSSLGLGATSAVQATPLKILTGQSWTAVQGGGCGLAASGTMYCFGLTADGKTGTGSAATFIGPTSVSGGYNFASLGQGTWGFCGVTTTGVGYCWGRGDLGQNGDGSLLPSPLPTQVRDP